VLGIVRLRRERAFARSAAQAPGMVIGFQRRLPRGSANRSGSQSYDFPVVRYTKQAGQTVEFASRSATRPRVVREGQAVNVLYDPAAPQRVRIASDCLQYRLPVFFITFGLGMALFAALFGFFAWMLLSRLPTT
jgi:hypothetical protein